MSDGAGRLRRHALKNRRGAANGKSSVTKAPEAMIGRMTADQLFQLANPVVLPGWLLLIVAPRWRWTVPAVRALIVPLLAVTYAAVILARFGATDGGFGSLAEVQRLFADPMTLVAGWIHYLAFDLFIGAWIVEDALTRRASAWLRIGVLPFTFLFGPMGLLLYLAGRVAFVRAPAAPAIS